MMPGHTHEDIDAMFRFIADALRKKGLIRTIDEFVEATTHAFRAQNVHVEHVAAVYDYTSWLKPRVSLIDQIRSARYFVIGLRQADSVPVMWYKPNVAHAYLYPTQKDPTTGMPLHRMVDGEKVYETDPNGIEIFAELPTGEPGLQEFDTARLDLSATLTTTNQIMDLQPHSFGESARAWWKTWAECTPTSVAEAVQKYGLSFTWPTPAAEWRPPTLSGLRSEYEETVTYVNTVGGQTFTEAQSTQAAVEENDRRPELIKGDMIVVIPGSDDGMHRLPFWLAEMAESAPSAQDSLEILWRAPFKGGYMKDDVHGQWSLICKGSAAARGGQVRYHAYTSKCRAGNRDKAGHGVMTGTVQRDEVAIYFAKLTDRTEHM